MRVLVTGGTGVLGRALSPLARVAGQTPPGGIYNVCRDGERVSNRRFRRAVGWHPSH
jgi:hypothetical protein